MTEGRSRDDRWWVDDPAEFEPAEPDDPWEAPQGDVALTEEQVAFLDALDDQPSVARLGLDWDEVLDADQPPVPRITEDDGG